MVDYGGDYGDAIPGPSNGNGQRNNMTATILYFRLKNPPKIHAAWGKPNRQGGSNMNYFEQCMSNRRACFYERVRELLDCGWNCIGKSNVLKLVLWPHDLPSRQTVQQGRFNRNVMGNTAIEWHETVNEILSRVRTRTGCRVYFTGIRCKLGCEPSITVMKIFFNLFFNIYVTNGGFF